MFTAADDVPSAAPVVVISHHVWQGTYAGDPSMIGATLFVEGHAFTVAGVTPPGFFGETLRGDPPDLWIPLQQEPLINGDTSILRQPVSAWLRVIGRLRPGAKHRRARRAPHRHAAPVDRARLRLSGQLDAGRHAGDAAPGDRRSTRRRGRRRDEGAVQPQPADSARRVRSRAAHRLRQRCEPPARACGGAAFTDRPAARHRRVPAADRHAGAGRERAPRRCRRHRRPRGRDGHGAHAAGAGVCGDHLPADRHAPGADGAGVCVGARAHHRRRLWRRPGVVRDPDRSDRRAARRRPQHGRSLVADTDHAPRRAGDRVRGPRRRIDDAGAQPRQPRAAGHGLRDRRTGARGVEPAAGDLHRGEARRAQPRPRRAAERRCRACRAPGWRSTTRSRTTGAKWCWWPGSPCRGRKTRWARRGIASAPTICRTSA